MLRKAVLGLIVVAALAGVAQAQWIGAHDQTGTTPTTNPLYEFANTANWTSGTINGAFTTNYFTAATTLYVKNGTTVIDSITASNASGSDLTLRSVSGPFTLGINTLVSSTGASKLNLGNTGKPNTDATAVNLDFGGNTVEFYNTTNTTSIGNNASNGGILKTGAASLNLQNPTSFTGPLIVRNGAVGMINDAHGTNLGGAVSTKDIRIMAYDNAAAASTFGTSDMFGMQTSNGLIPDDAVIRLFGASNTARASFNYVNTRAATVFETVGEVKALTGESILNVGDNVLTAGQTMTLTIGTLTRANNAVIRPTGVAGGTNTPGILGTQSKIMVSNPAGLVVGSGTGTAVGVIPWLYLNTSYSLTSCNTVATYDSVNGIVALDPTNNYFSVDGTAGKTFADAANQNIRLTTAAGTTSLGNADVTANIFVAATAGQILDLNGHTLNLTNGVLMPAANANVQNGTVNFGSVEGFVYGNGGKSLNAVIANTSGNTLGVTYASPANTTNYTVNPLTGDPANNPVVSANTYSGPTNIVSGTLIFSGGAAIPSASDVFVHPGAQMRIGGSTSLHEVQQIASLNGGAPINPGTNTPSGQAPANVRLVNANSATGSDGLVIGTPRGGSADYGRVVLNGGTISPGFANADTRIGTINVLSDTQGTTVSYPIELVSGNVNIDLGGDKLSDRIANTGAAGTIVFNPSGNLNLNVQKLSGYTPTSAHTWTIMTTANATGIDTTAGRFSNDVLVGSTHKIAFADSGSTVKRNSVTISYNAADVTLSSYGTAAFSSTPAADSLIDLGSGIAAGTGTASTTLTPSNTGAAATEIQLVSYSLAGGASSPFSLTGFTANQLLTAGLTDTANLGLLFTAPATAGDYTDTLTLMTSEGNKTYNLKANVAAAITLLPGDANEDGKVSFADYILLANNFGQTSATWQMGDFNADGKVSFADYILLANNFGQHVPEPATLGLLLIGGLGLIRRNRK